MKIETSQQNSDSGDEFTDSDTAQPEEISDLFSVSDHLCTQSLGHKRPILDISANRETNPYIATTLSDYSTEVFQLTDNCLANVGRFKEHTSRVVKCKFSPLNNHLFYTGSNDGTIKLWDLRDPNKSVVTFKDTTSEESNLSKSISCFDISPCDRLLAAGTDLTEGDAFILFWDVRNVKLLGAYWESHTDDITEVQFQPNNSNKLMSGSTDGLINTYNLLETSEDDALEQCLNTNAFVESLLWFEQGRRWNISCATSTNDVQLWETDGAEAYKRFARSDVAAEIKKSPENTYISKIHCIKNLLLILCGFSGPGQSFGSLIISNNKMMPAFQFKENTQIVRASCLNCQNNILLTGGEKSKLDVWKLDWLQIDLKI